MKELGKVAGRHLSLKFQTVKLIPCQEYKFDRNDQFILLSYEVHDFLVLY